MPYLYPPCKLVSTSKTAPSDYPIKKSPTHPTVESPPYRIVKLPNYPIAKLPNCRIVKLYTMYKKCKVLSTTNHTKQSKSINYEIKRKIGRLYNHGYLATCATLGRTSRKVCSTTDSSINPIPTRKPIFSVLPPSRKMISRFSS